MTKIQSNFAKDLRELKSLFEDKLITKEEYKFKREKVLGISQTKVKREEIIVKCPHCLNEVEIKGEGEFLCAACDQQFNYSKEENYHKSIIPGRINRVTFFIIQAGLWIGSGFVSYILQMLDNSEVLAVIFIISIIAINLVTLIRRLHDVELSGIYLLVLIIPGINFLFYLYLLFQPGTEGKNKYGEQS